MRPIRHSRRHSRHHGRSRPARVGRCFETLEDRTLLSCAVGQSRVGDVIVLGDESANEVQIDVQDNVVRVRCDGGPVERFVGPRSLYVETLGGPDSVSVHAKRTRPVDGGLDFWANMFFDTGADADRYQFTADLTSTGLSEEGLGLQVELGPRGDTETADVELRRVYGRGPLKVGMEEMNLIAEGFATDGDPAEIGAVYKFVVDGDGGGTWATQVRVENATFSPGGGATNEIRMNDSNGAMESLIHSDPSGMTVETHWQPADPDQQLQAKLATREQFEDGSVRLDGDLHLGPAGDAPGDTVGIELVALSLQSTEPVTLPTSPRDFPDRTYLFEVESSGETGKNDARFWKSRSGHQLLFDDTAGSEQIRFDAHSDAGLLTSVDVQANGIDTADVDVNAATLINVKTSLGLIAAHPPDGQSVDIDLNLLGRRENSARIEVQGWNLVAARPMKDGEDPVAFHGPLTIDVDARGGPAEVAARLAGLEFADLPDVDDEVVMNVQTGDLPDRVDIQWENLVSHGGLRHHVDTGAGGDVFGMGVDIFGLGGDVFGSGGDVEILIEGGPDRDDIGVNVSDATVEGKLHLAVVPDPTSKPKEIVVVGSKVKDVVRSLRPGLYVRGNGDAEELELRLTPPQLDPADGHAHGHLDYLKQVGDPATAPEEVVIVFERVEWELPEDGPVIADVRTAGGIDQVSVAVESLRDRSSEGFAGPLDVTVSAERTTVDVHSAPLGDLYIDANTVAHRGPGEFVVPGLVKLRANEQVSQATLLVESTGPGKVLTAGEFPPVAATEEIYGSAHFLLEVSGVTPSDTWSHTIKAVAPDDGTAARLDVDTSIDTSAEYELALEAENVAAVRSALKAPDHQAGLEMIAQPGELVSEAKMKVSQAPSVAPGDLLLHRWQASGSGRLFVGNLSYEIAEELTQELLVLITARIEDSKGSLEIAGNFRETADGETSRAEASVIVDASAPLQTAAIKAFEIEQLNVSVHSPVAAHAFQGQTSSANRRYLYFAKQADVEGYPESRSELAIRSDYEQAAINLGLTGNDFDATMEASAGDPARVGAADSHASINLSNSGHRNAIRLDAAGFRRFERHLTNSVIDAYREAIEGTAYDDTVTLRTENVEIGPLGRFDSQIRLLGGDDVFVGLRDNLRVAGTYSQVVHGDEGSDWLKVGQPFSGRPVAILPGGTWITRWLGGGGDDLMETRSQFELHVTSKFGTATAGGAGNDRLIIADHLTVPADAGELDPADLATIVYSLDGGEDGDELALLVHLAEELEKQFKAVVDGGAGTDVCEIDPELLEVKVRVLNCEDDDGGIG